MAVIDLEKAAAGNALTNPLGSATPGNMKFLLEALKLVNDIAHSPLASSIATRIQGQGGGTTFISSPVENQPPQQTPQQQPVQQPTSKPAEPEMNEQQFLAFLSTSKGRERIAAGLEQVKQITGEDLTISKMIEILRSGNFPEQKPKENK